MVLPLNHINLMGLVVLKLQDNIHFKIPALASICFPTLQSLHLYDVTFAIASNSYVHFPTLKILKLWCVKYADEDSVHRLFSSCPVLDNLNIYTAEWDNISCLIVRIPSLTTLALHFWPFDDRSFELQIDTPALQYLLLEDNSKCDYLNVGNFSSLLEAKVKFDIDINGTMRFDDNTYSSTIFRFIEQLSRVKFLSLSGHSLKAIRTTSINSFPGFHNLTRVELEQHECLDWQVLIKTLLPSMDNLEHLVMKGGVCNGSHESWWIEPLNAPKCLLWRVTNISFINMRNDCGDELELLRYVLKKANFLQLLKITSFLASNEKLKLVQKISMFPRGSQTCQVAFT